MSTLEILADPALLTGASFALDTFVVLLAKFMNVRDSSIANVAIPTISENLGVSIDEGTWVITLFAAANAVPVPLSGWLTHPSARSSYLSRQSCCLSWPPRHAARRSISTCSLLHGSRRVPGLAQ